MDITPSSVQGSASTGSASTGAASNSAAADPSQPSFESILKSVSSDPSAQAASGSQIAPNLATIDFSSFSASLSISSSSNPSAGTTQDLLNKVGGVAGAPMPHFDALHQIIGLIKTAVAEGKITPEQGKEFIHDVKKVMHSHHGHGHHHHVEAAASQDSDGDDDAPNPAMLSQSFIASQQAILAKLQSESANTDLSTGQSDFIQRMTTNGPAYLAMLSSLAAAFNASSTSTTAVAPAAPVAAAAAVASAPTPPAAAAPAASSGDSSASAATLGVAAHGA